MDDKQHDPFFSVENADKRAKPNNQDGRETQVRDGTLDKDVLADNSTQRKEDLESSNKGTLVTEGREAGVDDKGIRNDVLVDDSSSQNDDKDTSHVTTDSEDTTSLVGNEEVDQGRPTFAAKNPTPTVATKNPSLLGLDDEFDADDQSGDEDQSGEKKQSKEKIRKP